MNHFTRTPIEARTFAHWVGGHWHEGSGEPANDTAYGLSAGIWTRDVSTAMLAAQDLKAGSVWINTYLDGPAELPFGGYGESGVGRENGLLGVEEFTDVKTVQIRSHGYQKRWVGKTLNS